MTTYQFIVIAVLLAVAWSWLCHKALQLHLKVSEQKWRIEDLEQDRELNSIAHVKHVARHNELCGRMSRNEELARARSRRIRRRVFALSAARNEQMRSTLKAMANGSIRMNADGGQ